MKKYNETIGVYSEHIWIPTPTDIMKRAALIDVFKPCLSNPGSVIEIGSGAGALIQELMLHGFWGKGVETSENALNVARAFCQEGDKKFIFEPATSNEDIGSYDYVIAIAVLEHIEDDINALRQWRQFLRPGGKMLIAVPGHMALWGPNDVWAGHYRRYDRSALIETVGEADFSIEAVHAYGYPLINLIKRILRKKIGNRVYRTQKLNSEFTKEEASSNSGIDRGKWSQIFFIYSSRIFNIVWRFMFFIQSLFYNTEKGTGYILLAEKK